MIGIDVIVFYQEEIGSLSSNSSAKRKIVSRSSKVEGEWITKQYQWEQ
jgi:hypothetical protein